MYISRPMSSDELDTLVATLADTSACAQPDCSKSIQWRKGRGRRQRFCSGACRAKFSRDRTRLHQLLRRLGDTRGPDAPISDDLYMLENQIHWLLEAYGGVDEYLLRESVFTRVFPTPESILDWSRRRREADDKAMRILLDHAGD